jgi:hypothetical protein
MKNALVSPTGLVASLFTSVPSAFITKISDWPRLSNLEKAILPLSVWEAGLVVSPVPAFCAAQLVSTTARIIEATRSRILPVANRFTLEKIRLFIFFSFLQG